MMKRVGDSWKSNAPGLISAFLVAVVAKGVAQMVPQLGGATLAILLGIALGNSLLRQPILANGTKFAESRLLEYSVVLLGVTVTFQTLLAMGVKGVFYILAMMSIVIFSTYFLGKKLQFNQKMSLMMAGGNAVCGSSAIGSIAPAIQANEAEKGQIIALVNLLGTVMMGVLPFLGMVLFPDNRMAQSALIGGTLQSVGQVVAGASLIHSQVVQYAMLFKMMRIFMLVFVVLLFERIINKSNSAENHQEAIPFFKKKRSIPWYIIGFVICCLVSSTFALPDRVQETTSFISTWFETTALAAIGLRLDLRKFLKEGPKFLLYGLGVGTIQTISAIVLVHFLHF